MTDVIDFDELAGGPKTVRIGGQEYSLPADIPIDLFFEITEFETRVDDPNITEAQALAITRDFADKILELFQIHQPDMSELPGGLGIKSLITFTRHVYKINEADLLGEDGEDGGAEGNAPRPSPARKTSGATKRSPAKSRRSTAKKPPAKSRSRSRS